MKSETESKPTYSFWINGNFERLFISNDSKIALQTAWANKMLLHIYILMRLSKFIFTLNYNYGRNV